MSDIDKKEYTIENYDYHSLLGLYNKKGVELEESYKRIHSLRTFQTKSIIAIITLSILLVAVSLTCIGLGYAVSEERSKNEQLTESLTQAQNDLTECSKEIESLETKLYESQQESSKWEEMAERLDKTVEEMSETIASLEAEVQILETVVIGFNTPKEWDYEPGQNDVKILAGVMFGEEEGNPLMAAGAGSVVINRVNDPRFPSTIEDVVYEKVVTAEATYEQYAPRTKSIIQCVIDGKPIPKSLADMEYVPEWYFKIANLLIKYGSMLPEGVVYQAHFKQGTGVYFEWDGEYLCFG